MCDIEVIGRPGDTVFVVVPRNETARHWLLDHVDGKTTWLGDALAVEHRYIGPLIEGMVNDGLEVEA